MFKDVNFRLGIISALFTICLISILPKTPVVIKSSLLNMDSYIGGYYVRILGDSLVLDLTDFKKSLNFGPGVRYLFEFDSEGNTQDEILEKKNIAKDVLTDRLTRAGHSDFRISFSDNESDSILGVDVPKFVDKDRIIALSEGSGKILIRTLVNPDTWDSERFSEFYNNYDAWQDSEVTEKDILFLKVLSKSANGAQIQFIFTEDGRRKFFDLAAKNINLPMALYLDGATLPSAMPVVSDVLFQNVNADPVISGAFDYKSVEEMTTKIKSPSLPFNLIYSGNYQEIDPSYGADIFKRIILGILIGFFLICFYFVYKFKVFGFYLSLSYLFGLTIYTSLYKLLGIPVNTLNIFGYLFSMILISYQCLLFGEKMMDKKSLDISLVEANKKFKPFVIHSWVQACSLFLILFLFSSGVFRTFVTSIMVGYFVYLLNFILAIRTSSYVYVHNLREKR